MTTSRSAPIIQRIERILLDQHGEPIKLLELHKQLRRQGAPPPLDRLRGILAERDLFTELAGERYVLRDQLEPSSEAAQEALEQHVFLKHLQAAQNAYLVLDIETNGLDSERDQMVQLSVLHVSDGQAQRFYEWFFQCDADLLSSTLRRILHLDDATIHKLTTAAPLVEQLPEIRAVIADLPLVIHNARFDSAFLKQAMPELANPIVDTMELALLVAPHAPNHKLSTLAAYLGIAPVQRYLGPYRTPKR